MRWLVYSRRYSNRVTVGAECTQELHDENGFRLWLCSICYVVHNEPSTLIVHLKTFAHKMAFVVRASHCAAYITNVLDAALQDGATGGTHERDDEVAQRDNQNTHQGQRKGNARSFEIGWRLEMKLLAY